ncbi:hypothetical protein DID75_02620 [Candidatus Marinamargulisbacteria bacterium SCGC AG-410-N11]|nr:hypothetical protein DID75_02620 [Candidatus Marinamargulisbacteria bacterium SCGC AG-410-N11]
MISTENLTLSFGGNVLFEDVSVKFLTGNCYGLIGANGAGKSTFLKILSGDIEPTQGQLRIDKDKRIAVLKQDQFEFDDFTVLDTVLMGYKELYEVYAERNVLYSKDEMTDAEGERAGDLEVLFAEMDGYNAESDAAKMLSELNIEESLHTSKMKDLESGQKIRVLLAQALFGNPDILLLDEPTNQLDYVTVLWLEKFLLDFQNTVIVVSHDRHFLNKVCTHIADLDFKQVKIYIGNYSFWEQASQLAMQQKKDQHKKQSDKIKELEDFVRRFSANASKSKQATSRKKLIEKLRPEDIPESSRRSPFIQFNVKRECGDKILNVHKLNHSINGEKVLSNVSFKVAPHDKIAVLGRNSLSKTALLEILSGTLKPDKGSIEWGSTASRDFFPKDNTNYFNGNQTLMDWLGQFADDMDDQDLRALLGRMLFSGDDVFKETNVLSGGEKARVMFSKLMISKANVLLFDEPTDHLDLESISSLNKGLVNFTETLFISSHDFQLLNTVVNRVIEVGPKGFLDRYMGFEDYIVDEKIKEQRAALY